MLRYVPVLTLLTSFVVGPAMAEEEYGSISGRFVFDGDVPKLQPLVLKGGTTPAGMPVKDAAVCGAQDVADESLIVDPKTKGIANVFIYLKSAPDEIHPSLVDPPSEPVPFTQKGCSFIPHALFARAGQGVAVGSMDAAAHNTHTFPIKNDAVNFLLPPNPPKPVTVPTPKSEILPIQVKCDIHSWMTSYWLILDHPYATVSAADGTFKIEKLPVGEYSFRVWHERAGYLDRGLDVVVKPGVDTPIDTDETTYEAKDFED